MGKYVALLRYEAKTIVRDPMNLYMCLFALIVLFLSAGVFPMLLQSTDVLQGTMLKVAMVLLVVVILAFGSFFLAAMATFLLLEQKDEHTLHTIAVTPVGTAGYLKFKMAYIYLMSVAGNIVVLVGTKLLAGDKYVILGRSLFDDIGFRHAVAFALVNGLFTLVLGLMQGAFARNKVEGFALIKGTGMLALVPAVMVLETFHGNLQYVLGIFPNFWPIKGMLVKLLPVEFGADLSFPVYLLIGAVYSAVLLVAAYRFFLRKAQF